MGENAFAVGKAHLPEPSFVAKNADRAVNRGSGDAWQESLRHMKELFRGKGALQLFHCGDHGLFPPCIPPFCHQTP